MLDNIKMKLLNLREIEEKYGTLPFASYNFHKNFPQFADFLYNPTILGYNTQKTNKMLAEPEYAVGAGGINANNMVGASFWDEFYKGFKTGLTETLDIGSHLLPLVGLGREEHAANKSDSEAEEEEHEQEHVEHEKMENKKLKKVKKLADSMLKANKRVLRAELIRKIMKERGVSMIKASQIIKQENLKY
jgi:hypothetical protein